MRASLASSIAVTCAAVLALPVTLAAPAAGSAAPPAASALPPGPELPGSTQSLPLAPLGGSARAFGGGATGTAEQGLARRHVRPFSLVGVVWDDPAAALHGTVQVRTRATADGAWSEWQDVETHHDEHGADPDTAEGASGALKGSTAPLWVGDSDGVEIRVRSEEGAAAPLPAGLRVELVDPGEAPADASETAASPETAVAPETVPEAAPDQAFPDQAFPDQASSDAAAPRSRTAALPRHAPYDSVREVTRPVEVGVPRLAALRTETSAQAEAGQAEPGQAEAGAAAPLTAPVAAPAKPYIGPRPKIITRKGWGADEKIREKGFVYTKTIKAAFVHHSATGNNYTCRQAPSVLRSIYRYHVLSSGWRDFGYNFAVDKCGNIYEGRAGGVAKPVLGAHTLGFNTNSMGIAVLGTFSKSNPPAAVVTAVARLTAWKLGLHGVNPKGSAYLISGGGNLYKKGTKVKFNAIAGHRDGFATECPGVRLYGKLGTARTSSAKYQGRR
ncbi:N-acetylmuramoyl-L-alanine amidase [Streptomyces sp. NPDC003327]